MSSSTEQNNNTLKVKALKITIIIACIALYMIAVIGMVISIFMGSVDLCTIRSTKTSQEVIDPIYTQKSLLASGKYSQNSSYGGWLNTSISAQKDLLVEVDGSVSLCMGYITKNNLYQDSELDNDNKLIPIPRTNTAALGLPIILDTEDYWRNAFHVLDQDLVTITFADNATSSSYSTYDVFSQSTKIFDCSSELINLPSACGRYSPFYNLKYTSEYSCEYTGEKEDFCDCSGYDISVNDPDFLTWETCVGNCKSRVRENTCYCRNEGFACGPCTCKASCRDKYQSLKYAWKSKKEENILLPYSKDTTAPFFNNANKSSMDFAKNIKTSPDSSCENTTRKKSQSGESVPESKKTEKRDYPLDKKWLWFRANDKTGLIYRFSKDLTKDPVVGEKYMFFNKNSSNKQEFKITAALTGIDKSGYLQLRLYKPEGSIASTGGYLLYLKQTKCYRENGAAISDTYQNRGQILYLKSQNSSPTTQEINQAKPLVFYKQSELNGNSIYKITNESSQKGNLWLKIDNDKNDYKDSDGAYKLTIYDGNSGKIDILGFGDLMANAIKQNLDYGINMFKKMTCYKSVDKQKCFDLFLYIKVILTLYVMFMGMSIAIGYMNIDNYDLIKRVTKIIFLSGIISEYTFDFFVESVFPIVIYGPMQIISNINGYDTPNPFDSIRYYLKPASLLFSETIISGMFWQHLLSLIVTSIFGPLVVVFVILGVINILIVALKFVVIAFMGSIANSVIIGMAPIFLSFILFEQTRYLFDSWLKILVRFFIEIVIVGFGLTIFINLFLIFLDQITAYSVCFKCALPIFIPLLAIEIDLLCLNWFLPWGFELGDMNSFHALSLSVTLFMISSLAKDYLEVANDITSKLSNAIGSVRDYAMYSKIFSKRGLNAIAGMLKDTKVTAYAKTPVLGIKKIARLIRRGKEESHKPDKEAETKEKSKLKGITKRFFKNLKAKEK